MSDYLASLADDRPRSQQDGSDLRPAIMAGLDTVDPAELVKLCAADTELFAKLFFPRTYRQQSPSFARELWDLLEGPHRMINAEVFRGGSKTTRARTVTAKLIAYGLAHTVLYIGKSEAAAIRSVRWLKKQIMFNTLFAQTYGLRPSESKWTDVECEIIHDVDDYAIWVMALGMGGSIRGINQDDFRPDLIVMDDIHDIENSGTPEQRLKIKELVYSSIIPALAPASESPHAKIMNLFTPLHKEDVGCEAMADEGWKSLSIPCWTKDTLDQPSNHQVSVWPERYPTVEVRRDKELAAKRNKLSSWLREYELKLVAPETASFRSDWLQRWTVLPDGLVTFLAIDPVPPPSAHAVSKGLHKHDYEAIAVIGIAHGKYYVLDISVNRGHDPSWTCAEVFRLARRWQPRRFFVEAVAYQRTLAWILRQEMVRQAKYFAIEEITDQRSKHDRIVDGLNGVASNGALLLPQGASSEGFAQFLDQFAQYPSVSHDDALEAVAMAVTGAAGRYDIGEFGEGNLAEEAREFPRLAYSRGAP